jgi:hypothetical protein
MKQYLQLQWFILLKRCLRRIEQNRFVSLIIHGALHLVALFDEPLLLEIVLLGII